MPLIKKRYIKEMSINSVVGIRSMTDFTTKRIVSDILEDYPGTIIMVSHDRYFANKIAEREINI